MRHSRRRGGRPGRTLGSHAPAPRSGGLHAIDTGLLYMALLSTINTGFSSAVKILV
jgi:hypothetical protein